MVQENIHCRFSLGILRDPFAYFMADKPKRMKFRSKRTLHYFRSYIECIDTLDPYSIRRTTTAKFC